MKVVHLISGGDAGGAKTHVLSLLAGLKGKAQVKLVCFMPGPFADEARALGIDVTILQIKNPLKEYAKLKKLILDGGYQIIHSHGSRGNMMSALMKGATGLPVVTTVHSDYKLDYLGRPLARMTYGIINSLSLRRIDYRIGVSDPVTDMLADRGFAPQRLFTIYNSLDFNVPPRALDRAAFLRALGLDYQEGDVVAGIAARLNPVKDIATLLRAFAAALRSAPRLKLVIAGDGELRGALEKQAEQLGIAGRVCFAGWVDDTDGFYRSIDINLLTSLSETFPYVLTEGARMRCATVSSRVGGTSVLIDHAFNGFLFEPGDDAALAQHLVTLAQDPSLRVKMGNALREKAERLFSMDEMIAKQLEIYRIILRREGRPKERRDGVTICGAYGRGNTGDDSILEAVIDEMRSIDPDMPIRVLSRSPKTTARAYRVRSLYTFNLWSFGHALRHSRLFINGGGSLIQDVTSRRSLYFYLYTIAKAARSGCRVMMYGCGIGPVSGKLNRRIAARVINRHVDVVTLREDDSFSQLQSMGVSRPEIKLSADPALFLRPAPAEAVNSAMLLRGLEPDGKYIGFALRPWPGFERKIKAIAQAAEYAYRTYGLTPVFIPIEKKADLNAAKLAAERIGCPHHILQDLGNSAVTVGLLSRMQVMVAMRLHALILTAGQGVPLVGIVYDPKVNGFLRYVGQDLHCPLEEVTRDALTAFIDTAVSRRADPQPLKDAVARLLSLERENIRQAARLLGKDRP